MADTTQKYAGKKRKPQIYRGMKIRPRGGSWQADFGTKAGKRDQKSFGSLDEAKQAIDSHLIQKVEQSRFEAAITSKYKKPETIATHLESLHGSHDGVMREKHARTALDGAYGEVVVIGYAIDGEPPRAVYRGMDEPEENVLKAFFDAIPVATQQPVHWVGHNILGFDLRFLQMRSWVTGIRSGHPLPLDSRPGTVYDTMTEWAGRYQRNAYPSLDKLCKAFSIPSPKGEVDGSNVYSMVEAGRLEDVVEYCKQDVIAVREVYRRMTWDDR